MKAFWASESNFGDALTPVIIQKFSGRPPEKVGRGIAGKLLCVGSVLSCLKDGDTVYGSGFQGADEWLSIGRPKGVEVSCVRGPLSRERLLAAGVGCPEVYGDPALLLPVLFPVPRRPMYDIGVVPHYVDFARLSKLRSRGVLVIDVNSGVQTVIRELAKCAKVVSSSLHGVIAAEAYGIPAAWAVAGDKVCGKGFKFRDYYAATGRAGVSPIDWTAKADPSDAVRRPFPPKPPTDLTALIKACPFAARPLRKEGA